jgi:hypothetical protein
MDNYNNLIKMYLDAKKEHKDAEFVRHENVKVVYTTTNRSFEYRYNTDNEEYSILYSVKARVALAVKNVDIKTIFIDTTTNRIYDDQLVTNDDTYTILVTRRKENDSDQ